MAYTNAFGSFMFAVEEPDAIFDGKISGTY